MVEPRPVPRTGPGLKGARARNAPRDFAEYREDYAYVRGDLRRIFIVTAILTVLMVVLWLLLGQTL